MGDADIAWGPTGQAVYERTYARPKPDGTLETWPETVDRVVVGNLALVHGEPAAWGPDVVDEARRLREAMLAFDIVPAGRHLWATGVPGRQYLLNCWAAGWNADHPADHATFLLLRLAEGGGVGANYSSRLSEVPVYRRVVAEFLLHPDHPDAGALHDAWLDEPIAMLDEYVATYVVEDSREGWADAVDVLITTACTPGDDRTPVRVLFDLSQVRPRGAPLRTFGGTASGPVPLAEALATIAGVLRTAVTLTGSLSPLDWLDIDHAIAAAIVSGGVRRSARMSILEWDDPWLDDFLVVKSDTSAHWTTNVSVAIDYAFLRALDDVDDPDHERAVDVLRDVVAGMLDNGEPGLWNRSLSQIGERGEVVTTNPCGEIALEPWEACDLGHVNLEHFVVDGRVDTPRLREAHALMARFLFRALATDYADQRTAAVEARNRRIGVGHFGLHGMLARLGVRYSEAPDQPWLRHLLVDLHATVRRAANEYADSLGMPHPVKVAAIAPTGTIAKLPGASEGIHPIYARHFVRRIRYSDSNPEQAAAVERYRAEGYVVEPDLYADDTSVVSFPTTERLVADLIDGGMAPGEVERLVEDASEIPPERMLAMIDLYQTAYVDNGIAFTVNVEPGAYTVDDLAVAIRRYLPRIKGVTVMPDGSRPQAPYERVAREAVLQGPVVVDDSYDENCASGACPVR